MLALVARLAGFGISVVLATHLLDDVQAVCDHVVMINAGQLVLAGPTTHLLERAGTVRVDVGGAHDGPDRRAPRPWSRLGDSAGGRQPGGQPGRAGSRRGPGRSSATRGRAGAAPARARRPATPRWTRCSCAERREQMTGDRSSGTSGSLGAIYDRGYRPYDGTPRRTTRTATFALYRASIRRALGLRRSWRQKVLPWTLLAIVTVPAVINVGVGYLTRNTPAEGFEFITYREYVGVSTALLLFVALTAPDVMCPDRRHRVLPLIFARPLRRPRLRGGEGGRHRHHPVRLQLPPPGRAVRRPDARERRRPRLPAGQRRGALAGARWPSRCWPSTTRPSASPSPR